ncbi:MAG: hypothetical protein ABIP47_09845 [Saprospiraceae bacterium]
MCSFVNKGTSQHINKFCNETYRFTPDEPETGPNPCDPLVIFTTFVYTFTSQIPTSSLSNGRYYITQDLIVNSNFSFSGCKLKFAPGVKITIYPNFKLNLIDCHLFTCSLLWKGINLYNNSNITTYNTLIEDAEMAIYNSEPINSCILSIEYTTFNKDVYGIHLSAISQVYGGSGSTVIARISRFRKNKFICTGLVKEINDITTAGIYLSNVSFQINLQVGPSNATLFKGIKYGILMEHEISPLKISFFNFDDIRITGIKAENGYLSLCKYLNFVNCKEGVNILNTYKFDL